MSLLLQISKNPLEKEFFNKKEKQYSAQKKNEISKKEMYFPDQNIEMNQVFLQKLISLNSNKYFSGY